jgi:hypothetical protein
MTAVRYDDVVSASVAPALGRPPRPRRRPPTTSGSPLMDVTTRVLNATLHHLYAALWRAGVIEVTA